MGKVEIIRHPTDADWARCRDLALMTIGKRYKGDGTDIKDEWKHKMLKSPHSPKRTLMFTIAFEVPYWVSVHFARHKFGVEHYVCSQRNDRQDKYDRNEAPQGALVMHTMDVNATELIQMANMRLCNQASPETRKAMREICDAVIAVNPEFEPFLVPQCVAHRGCDEFKSCGYWSSRG